MRRADIHYINVLLILIVAVTKGQVPKQLRIETNSETMYVLLKGRFFLQQHQFPLRNLMPFEGE